MTKQNMYNFAQNETIMINNIAQNQRFGKDMFKTLHKMKLLAMLHILLFLRYIILLIYLFFLFERRLSYAKSSY